MSDLADQALSDREAIRVFISYSHKDKDLLDKMVAQLDALETAKLHIKVWDDTRIDAGNKWYPEIEAAMEQAAVAVCLVSEHFLASRFCIHQEVEFLLKREGVLIIPVLLSDCPWYAHRWLEERQMLPGGEQSVRSNFPQNPAAVFSKVAKRIYDKLKDPNFQPEPPRWPPLPPDRIDLTHLSEAGTALFGRRNEAVGLIGKASQTGSALFGRQKELEALDKVWKSKRGRTQERESYARLEPIRTLCWTITMI